jgi:hypothetical protein
MRLALIRISAREAFGIMAACREELDGRACERVNEDETARLWVFATVNDKCVVLAWIAGEFYVGTRADEKEVLHAA